MAFVMTPNSAKCFGGSRQAAPAPRRTVPVVSILTTTGFCCLQIKTGMSEVAEKRHFWDLRGTE